MSLFKNKLNLLFISSIGEFLPEYECKYLVMPFSENEFFIQFEPSFYHGCLKDIYNLLCYDYDLLSEDLKRKYENDYKSFEKIQDNLYHLVVKNYTFKSKKRNI